LDALLLTAVVFLDAGPCVILTLVVLLLVFFDSAFFARLFGLVALLCAGNFVVRDDFRVIASSFSACY
jgi:hypothetical protein